MERGNALFLDGDLMIDQDCVLAFTSDTIIDGRGHSIILADGTASISGGQLYINGPSGTTVTFRNVKIHGVKTFETGVDAISFGLATNQTLVLDNVELYMPSDYYFTGGSLEIHNRVELHGRYQPNYRPTYLQPSIFWYTASNDCTITADSMLVIDMTVGFIYYPFDALNTHIVFTDPSSELFLNGSILYVPSSIGLKLLVGHMIVDHHAELQSDNNTGKSIDFGDKKNISNDFIVDILPAAKLEIEDALVRYQNHE
jgi:hypothetical protein